mmetsp:Transcript_12389/g.26396  ORF Transcript_12389/g.26396 Transcript_12389/m.26396 type:complete len:259 (-) Transcript_12389:309-1085(-)
MFVVCAKTMAAVAAVGGESAEFRSNLSNRHPSRQRHRHCVPFPLGRRHGRGRPRHSVETRETTFPTTSPLRDLSPLLLLLLLHLRPRLPKSVAAIAPPALAAAPRSPSRSFHRDDGPSRARPSLVPFPPSVVAVVVVSDDASPPPSTRNATPPHREEDETAIDRRPSWRFERRRRRRRRRRSPNIAARRTRTPAARPLRKTGERRGGRGDVATMPWRRPGDVGGRGGRGGRRECRRLGRHCWWVRRRGRHRGGDNRRR